MNLFLQNTRHSAQTAARTCDHDRFAAAASVDNCETAVWTTTTSLPASVVAPVGFD